MKTLQFLVPTLSGKTLLFSRKLYDWVVRTAVHLATGSFCDEVCALIFPNHFRTLSKKYSTICWLLIDWVVKTAFFVSKRTLWVQLLLPKSRIVLFIAFGLSDRKLVFYAPRGKLWRENICGKNVIFTVLFGRWTVHFRLFVLYLLRKVVRTVLYRSIGTIQGEEFHWNFFVTFRFYQKVSASCQNVFVRFFRTGFYVSQGKNRGQINLKKKLQLIFGSDLDRKFLGLLSKSCWWGCQNFLLRERNSFSFQTLGRKPSAFCDKFFDRVVKTDFHVYIGTRWAEKLSDENLTFSWSNIDPKVFTFVGKFLDWVVRTAFHLAKG